MSSRPPPSTALLLAMCTLLVGCSPPADDGVPASSLRLRWVQGFPGDTWDEALAGLLWDLASLGAPLVSTGVSDFVAGDQSADFTLDLGAVGFSEAQAAGLTAATADLATSDELADYGAVDLGRFLMLTLYSPWRYYAATGACATLAEWQATHLQADRELYGITTSLLVSGDRLVELNPPTGHTSIAFLATESAGTFADGTFFEETTELETIDVMPNGQQRYAVYDASGALVPGASATVAGQPGKCMWCHEDDFQYGTDANPTTAPWLSYAEFAADLDLLFGELTTTRAAEPTAVDYTTYDVHEWGEHVTEGFLAPSAGRLAIEWGSSADAVRADLASLPTHDSAEYPDDGPFYTRSDVDDWLATDTFEPVPTLPSARETPVASGLPGSVGDVPPCGAAGP